VRSDSVHIGCSNYPEEVFSAVQEFAHLQIAHCDSFDGKNRPGGYPYSFQAHCRRFLPSKVRLRLYFRMAYCAEDRLPIIVVIG
jgi:hypothetical protein